MENEKLKEIVYDVTSVKIKAQKRRWLLLIFFNYYSTFSCLQWSEYTIINNIIMKYYNVSASAVDWTSVVYMFLYPIFLFPATFMIDRWGLKFAVTTGCILTTLGTGIKVFSCDPNSFGFVLIGQALISIAQVFIMSLPPKLALTWFKADEMSTVCSLATVGVQIGTALGFLLPPIIVKNHENIEDIGYDLKLLSWTLAIGMIPACICVLFIPHQPKYPPSPIQAAGKSNLKSVTMGAFFNSVGQIMKMKAFYNHIAVSSMCLSVFSAIGTVLNQLVLFYFPGEQEEAGRIGLMSVILGIPGTVLVGLAMDKTKKYKEINFLILLLLTICVGGFWYALEIRSKIFAYISMSFLGFFYNAFYPATMEFTTELTYPANESTTSGIMFAISQIFSMVVTMATSYVIAKYGTFWALAIQIAILAISTIQSLFTPNILHRQEVLNKHNIKLKSCLNVEEEQKPLQS